MDFANKFSSGLTYQEFLETHGTEQQQGRWASIHDQVQLSADQSSLLEGFVREMKVLVVAGAWCGDCVNQCPIFDHFSLKNPLIHIRYFDRDEHSDLATELSTCGGQRVPSVLFLSEDDQVCGRYGDRTLSRYREMAATQLGAACPTGIGGVEQKMLDSVTQEWLNEFEKNSTNVTALGSFKRSAWRLNCDWDGNEVAAMNGQVSPIRLLAFCVLVPLPVLVFADEEKVDPPKSGKAIVTVLSSDGKPLQITPTFSRATLGYNDSVSSNFFWPRHIDGKCHFEKIPVGKHHVIVNASLANASATTIKVGKKTRKQTVRLSETPAWFRRQEFDVVPDIKLITKLNGGETIIEALVKSNSDKPFTIGPTDIRLTTSELRVFPPKEDRHERKVVPPRQTVSLPLNWNRIVRKGLWTFRTEPISEPSMVLEDGAAETYVPVRVRLGGYRASLEVVVLRPERVLRGEIVPLYDKSNPSPVLINQPIAKNSPKPSRPGLTLYDLMDDWFWIDPYSHLGDISRNGDGWRFVRLAGDAEASKELKTTAKQTSALRAIHDLFQAGGPPGTNATGIPLWNMAREAAEPLLNDEQKRRLSQLMIQRRSYHAMLEISLQEKLGLSPDQREQIQDSVTKHNARIKDAENRLAKTIQAIAEKTGSRKLTEEVKLAKAEKLRSGWRSHKQVWLDIKKILTAEQTNAFIEIRGEKPKDLDRKIEQFRRPISE